MHIQWFFDIYIFVWPIIRIYGEVLEWKIFSVLKNRMWEVMLWAFLVLWCSIGDTLLATEQVQYWTFIEINH